MNAAKGTTMATIEADCWFCTTDRQRQREMDQRRKCPRCQADEEPEGPAYTPGQVRGLLKSRMGNESRPSQIDIETAIDGLIRIGRLSDVEIEVIAKRLIAGRSGRSVASFHGIDEKLVSKAVKSASRKIAAWLNSARK